MKHSSSASSEKSSGTRSITLERKRGLLEDRVYELTLRSPSLSAAIAAETGENAVTATIDRTIPVPDGQHITYYTVDGLDPELFVTTALEPRVPAEVRCIEQRGTWSRIEVVTREETLASALASHGGRIVEPLVQDGECRLVV